MGARWQGEPGGARSAWCLGAAVAVHGLVVLGASAHATQPLRVTEAFHIVQAFVETPAYAKPAEPAPVAASAPTPAAPPPPAPALGPERETLAGDPYDVPDPTLADRGREAASAAVAAARSLLTTEDASAAAMAHSDADLGPGFGLVAGDGLGREATFAAHAVIGGRPFGTGAGTPGRGGAGEQDTGPDRSRGSRVLGGLAEDCDFPIQAAGIDHEVAVVVVSVRADGTAAHVVVARDPGHGFGAAAKACALRRRYDPARDRNGRPVAGVTPPVNVRFTR